MKVGLICVLLTFITLAELQQVLSSEEDLLNENSLVVNENEDSNVDTSAIDQNSFGNKKSKEDDDDSGSNESNESDESKENDSSSTEKSKSKKKGKKNKKKN